MDLSKKEFLKDLRILYVEDEEIILSSMEKILKVFVKEVITAPNGKLGLEAFKNNDINLIITDVKMPELNGIEMSKEIKKINKDIPIIVTTAFVEAEFLIEAIDIGIDKYISKPAKANKLVNAIAEVIEPIQLKKELEDKTKKLEELNSYLEQRVQDEIQKNKEKDLLLLKQSKLVSVDKITPSHLKELKFYAKDLSVLVYEKEYLFDNQILSLVDNYFNISKYVTSNIEFFDEYRNNNYDLIIFSLNEKDSFMMSEKIKNHKATQKIIILNYFMNYTYTSPLLELNKEICLIDKNDTDKFYYTLLLETENISFENRKSKYLEKNRSHSKLISSMKPIAKNVIVQTEANDTKNEIVLDEEPIETEAFENKPKNVEQINDLIVIDPNDFDFDDIRHIKDDLETIIGELILDQISSEKMEEIHLVFTRFYNTFYTFLAVDLKYQLKPFADAVKEIGDFVKSLDFNDLDHEQKESLSKIEYIIEDIINFINYVFINKEIANLNYLEASLKDNLKLIKIELGLEKKEESANNMLLFF
jgi:YesN/AraC family two-component response regulator